MPASRDVLFRILGEDAATPAFNRAAASAEGAAARISRAGDRMVASGRKLTHTFTLPILAIAGASVKAATDFDASMTRIQTQAGASARDVQYLTKQVLAMKNVQYGPNELADALYHLKSVGLENAQAMKALRVSQDLAAVGGANLEETTNALAGAWRTGIRGAKNFHDAAATVNAIIGAGNMTLEQFNAAIGTGILPTAKTFGLTLKDVGSALALFTDEGIDSASAATRLRMSMSLLAAPSQAADKILAGIGLSGHQLGETLRKPDGLIKTVGLLRDHLQGLDNYYPNPTKAAAFVASMKNVVSPLLDKKNLTAAQQSLVNQYGMAKDLHEVLVKGKLDAAEQASVLSRAFGGGRSSSAILSLVNNFDVLQKKQDQVTRSLGRYDHAVKVQAATPQAQFKTALADLERAGVLTGRDLLPIVVSGARDVARLAQGFDSLSSGQKRFIIEGGLALAALGPLLTVTGKLGGLFVSLGAKAKAAALWMTAPYRQTEEAAQIAALRTEYANAQIQADEALTAAAVARAEADKAAAAEAASVKIALAAESQGTALQGVATQAGLDAIEFNAAMQAEAVAAQKMAAETAAAAEAAQLKLSTATSGASRGVYGLQSAMGGLVAGATIGMFTRNMSTTTKLVAGLGSAAAGAALGFATGGPLGAAIGGITGLVSSLGVSFFHMGHKATHAEIEAQAAMQAQQQTAQDLLNTLKSINGQYNKTARQAVAQQLQSTKVGDTGFSVLSAAPTLGIPIHKLVQGALGGTKAIDQILRQAARAARIHPENADLAQQFVGLFSSIVGGGGDAEKAWEQYAQAADGAIVPTKLLKQGIAGLAKELKGVGVSQIGPGSAFGERAQLVLRRNVQYTKEQALSQKDLRGSIARSVTAYYSQIAAIRNQLLLMGYQRDDIDKYLVKTAMVPKFKLTQFKVNSKQARAAIKDAQAAIDNIKQNKVPNLQVGTAQANADIRQLRNYIDSLHDKTISIDTIVHTSRTASRTGAQAQAVGTMAAFGTATIPPNTWFTVGEGGTSASWEGGHTDAQGRTSIFSNSQARAMGFADPVGYASGTGATGSRRHAGRKLKVEGGTLMLRAGGREFEAYVQDLVIAELDFAAGDS